MSNPLGMENQTYLYGCVPLVRDRGLLFDYSAVELGLNNFLSPAYVAQGLYARIAPLSFLALRVEALGMFVWPFPVDGAGYFPVQSYRAGFQGKDLPASEGRSATGLNLIFGATLRAAAELSERWSLFWWADFAPELWRMGESDFYFNVRRALILRREDWLVHGTGLFSVRYRLREDLQLRLGPIYDASWVPGSGYRAQTLGVIASAQIRRGLRGGSWTPYLRADRYLEHAFRSGFSLSAGFDVFLDVTP